MFQITDTNCGLSLIRHHRERPFTCCEPCGAFAYGNPGPKIQAAPFISRVSVGGNKSV